MYRKYTFYTPMFQIICIFQIRMYQYIAEYVDTIESRKLYDIVFAQARQPPGPRRSTVLIQLLNEQSGEGLQTD